MDTFSACVALISRMASSSSCVWGRTAATRRQGAVAVAHVHLGVGQGVLHLDALVRLLHGGDLLLLGGRQVAQVLVLAPLLVRAAAVLRERCWKRWSGVTR